MRRLVVHKEDLPAQVGIKRRRQNVTGPQVVTTTADIDEFGVATSVTTTVPNIHDNEDDFQRTDVGTCCKADENGLTSAVKYNCSDDEHSNYNDDDDDVAELERERRRIEQFQQEKQRVKKEKLAISTTGKTESDEKQNKKTTTSSSFGNAITSNNFAACGGVSSYNHDVLFRRRTLREGKNGNTAGETGTKMAKWKAVQNNTQKSATFQHFMKNYFK